MKHSQHGQTLIETMVALFIMVMGITAALGLANYSLNASSSISKQIIGIALAREGMEGVKSMRDTNWLNGQMNTSCWDYFSNSAVGQCYQDWLNPTSGLGYNLAPGSYFIGWNANGTGTNGFWFLGSALGNPWGLNASSDINTGIYYPSANSTAASGYYRQITISQDTSAPFDKQASGTFYWPRLLVQSRVWWTDKNCPATATWPGFGKCSIQFQSYLTNWKTY